MLGQGQHNDQDKIIRYLGEEKVNISKVVISAIKSFHSTQNLTASSMVLF